MTAVDYRLLWKGEMRRLDDYEARAADHLGGQAGVEKMGDGRVNLHVMGDAGTFPAVATISAEDARALAHAILDADTSPST